MAKLHLTNGDVHEVPSVTSAAIGYIATSIEIGAKDVTQMRKLFENDQKAFRAFIFQLEARFPENRCPHYANNDAHGVTEQPYEKIKRSRRDDLLVALAQPLPAGHGDIEMGECFDPWEHIIHGIYGNYAKDSDDLMIETLEAVRDRTTFELIKQKGFVVEFMLYVLAGQGLIEYGSSPRGGWPEHPDLWQKLIDKWKAYRDIAWGDD